MLSYIICYPCYLIQYIIIYVLLMKHEIEDNTEKQQQLLPVP